MPIQLSGEREQLVRSLVHHDRFATEDEVIDEALRLLKQHEDAEQASVLEKIQQGLDDMKSGRTQPLEDALDDIRRDLQLPQAS